MGASSVKPADPYLAPSLLQSNSANIARKTNLNANIARKAKLNANIARKAKLNANIAKELYNYNKLTPEGKIIAKQTNPKIANALSTYNKLHPLVKKAMATQNSFVGGRMKTRKRRATKKAHKNSRRHSRRN